MHHVTYAQCMKIQLCSPIKIKNYYGREDPQLMAKP
jgi:hypothetical protein